MKNIAVIPNPNKDIGLTVTKNVIKRLKELGAVAFLEEKLKSAKLEDCRYFTEFPKECEMIIVIGGDGSVLDASCLAIEHDIPMLGINLGRVGYLSELEPDNLNALERIFDGRYEIVEKMLLSTVKYGKEQPIASPRLALNDVVISHSEFFGISEFTVCGAAGGVKYRADGVVISTSAGSTAYSLSAGGPIVSHRLDALLVTPVCPHSFFDRSILFSPNESVKVKNTAGKKLNISVDGRCFCQLLPEEECVISRSEKRVKFLTFNENTMFSTLFEKMRIMEDIK